MVKYVLSVDGGGIRGIIATRILCEIEQRIQKPVGEVFDFFVGSSVGSIISAAFAIKTENGSYRYTATEVLALLLEYGPVLFATSLMRRLWSIFSGAQFSDINMEKVLKCFFGDETMGDISTHFMVPSYDIQKQNTVMIRNWICTHKMLKIRDVLRAACAAPTIFSPKEITICDSKCVLVDSGLVANNPSACGYSAIDFLYPGEQVYVLSLGCGSVQNDVVRTQARYGLTFWITNTVPIFLDAGMEVVDYQMNRVLGQERYIRINGALQKASYDFTDASISNINALQEDADRIILENSCEIEKFVSAYALSAAKCH